MIFVTISNNPTILGFHKADTYKCLESSNFHENHAPARSMVQLKSLSHAFSPYINGTLFISSFVNQLVHLTSYSLQRLSRIIASTSKTIFRSLVLPSYIVDLYFFHISQQYHQKFLRPDSYPQLTDIWKKANRKVSGDGK